MSQEQGPQKKRHKKEEAPKRASAPFDVERKVKKSKRPRTNKQQREDNKAWTPFAAARDARKAKGYQPKPSKPPVPISRLNQMLASPAREVKIVTEHRLNLYGSIPQSQLETFALNTPSKGIETSALVSDEVTLLRARTIESHTGKISIFLSQNKVDTSAVIQLPELPSHLQGILEELGLPDSTHAKHDDVAISLASIHKMRKLKGTRTQSRMPSNRQVSGYVSANNLAKALGLEGSDWQWLHLVGHSLWEEERRHPERDPAQFLDNFVLGTKNGNAKMNDLAESVVEEILKDKRTPDTLYLSAEGLLVEGFEKARLCNKVLWTLKDGPGENYSRMVKFEFNPLTTDTLCESEIEVFKEMLVSLFFQDEHKPIEIISPFKAGKAKPVNLLSTPSPKKSASRLSINREAIKPITFSFDDLEQPSFLEEDTLTAEDPNLMTVDQGSTTHPPPFEPLKF